MRDINVSGRVVVGVDGRGGSSSTVRWAAQAAAKHGRGLTLVMGYPEPDLPNQWRSLKTGRLTKRIKVQQARAEKELAKQVDFAKEVAPGLDVASFSSSQDGAGLLVAAAKTADLLVVGSHALDGVKGAALGGVVDSVLVHAASSVAVVPTGCQYGVDTGPVVVGVDESTDVDLTLKWALRSAHFLASDLEMLTAWQLPTTYGEAAPIGLDEKDFAEIEESSMDMLNRLYTQVADLYPAVKVTKKVVCDSPVNALVQASKQAQIIFVGNRGSGGFTGLLLGSTSRLLARQSECPVIVVRNRDPFDPQILADS